MSTSRSLNLSGSSSKSDTKIRRSPHREAASSLAASQPGPFDSVNSVKLRRLSLQPLFSSLLSAAAIGSSQVRVDQANIAYPLAPTLGLSQSNISLVDSPCPNPHGQDGATTSQSNSVSLFATTTTITTSTTATTTYNNSDGAFPTPGSTVPSAEDMAPKSDPLIPRDRPETTQYGSVSLSSRSSESSLNNAPRRAATLRSQKSIGSVSARSSRRLKSDELDSAVLVSGLESRFVPADTPIPGAAESDKANSETASIGNVDDDEENLAGSGSDSDEDDGATMGRDLVPDSVRASVPSTDNTTLSISTPRMWVLSTVFSIFGSATNLMFSLRYPSVALTPIIAALLVHPVGRGWDYLLKHDTDPTDEFVDGVRTRTAAPRASSEHGWAEWWDDWRLWLAQGRWNEKEHTCVYASSNVSFGFAFATDVIVEQSKFYKQDAPIMYQLMLVLSTQILGYAFAGLTRNFLVRPSSMVWPGTLQSVAMFTTLHKDENKLANGWRVSRWGFFLAVFLGSFVFYFLPGLLMPALSYFNVITWFAPRNVVVANLFGVSSGLGLFPLTFDWAQIAYIGSPLIPPFWVSMNVLGGFLVVMGLGAPVAYYINLFDSAYMPLLSAAVFDRTGKVYDVGKILTKDFLFDREAYQKYSRVFLPITYVFSYGVQFAALAALLTHTAIWHGRDIWRTWKRTVAEVRNEASGNKKDYRLIRTTTEGANASSGSDGEGFLDRSDVHVRLMRRYEDAPMSWYLWTFVSMLAMGIFVVEYYQVHLPWYGLFLALAICVIFFIPNGIIMGVTNIHTSTYLICQILCGFVFPGRPVANMLFVTYGYISSAQGLKFASDLKLGHYMKIPPRILFSVQMFATVVSSLTQLAVLNWMFAHVDGLCTPSAINGFSCPIARVHFNGSIIWGVVGPGEFFGPRGPYRILTWCFLAGALLPIPLWLYARRRPDSIVRKISLPVVFGTMSWIPPATGLNFSVWALVCYTFNYRIRRSASEWWAKYNMTLSAALDSGLAFGIIVVFFAFVYPGWMDGFSWWGTEVYKQGCDWQACPYRELPPSGHFGPDSW